MGQVYVRASKRAKAYVRSQQLRAASKRGSVLAYNKRLVRLSRKDAKRKGIHTDMVNAGLPMFHAKSKLHFSQSKFLKTPKGWRRFSRNYT